MDAFKKVSEKLDVSEQEVKNEISNAISEGMNSTDPEVQGIWDELFPEGGEPSPEALIEMLSRAILAQM